MFFSEVLIIEIGIKHEANVKIDNVLIGIREVEYRIAIDKAMIIPLCATLFDFINKPPYQIY